MKGQQMESTINWTSGMTFIASQDGHEIILDLPTDQGGLGLGAKPKTMLLTALGGCTAIDVVSILNKQRVEFEGLQVHTSADMTDEHPKVFKSIHIKYIFSGPGLPMEKLERAAALSMEKYCGVSAMLAKACPITYEVVLEG
jgi:putative redox protein